MTQNKPTPATGRRSRRVQGFAALLVATAVASGAVAWSVTGTQRDEPNAVAAPAGPGDKFKADVIADFGDISRDLVSYLKTVADWRAAKASDATATAAAAALIDNATATRAALLALAPFEPAPRALVDYRRSVDTYLQAAALTIVAGQLPAGDLRSQVQLAGTRVQTLGDRLFDQGGEELRPFTKPEPKFDGVEYSRPAEVPTFGSGDLAAGAPLAVVGAGETARDYQDSRPEQSFADWAALVHGAGLPTPAEEAAAITGGSAASLGDESLRFTQAADLLHDKPDPKAERIVSTRTQLALLIDAEATQLGLAASLARGAQHETLLRVAKSLAVIGDGLWDDRLGPRDTGFPQALLVPIQSPSP
jgi:hypothetical protein